MQTCEVKFKRTNGKFSLTQQLKRIKMIGTCCYCLFSYFRFDTGCAHSSCGRLFDRNKSREKPKILANRSSIYDRKHILIVSYLPKNSQKLFKIDQLFWVL